MINIELTANEVDLYLNKPINGRGGFQCLLKRIFKGLQARKKILKVSKADLEKVGRYAEKYGQGGFQDRLTPLLRKLNQ